MEIAIGYDLPFRASAYTTDDPILRIRVGCKRGTTHEDLARVETHGAVFIEAAMFGMGAGARVAPRLDRRSIDDALRVGFGREGLALEASVVIDPSYVVVLLHKLLCLTEFVDIEDVALELPGLAGSVVAVPIVRREDSELPQIYRILPFDFVDERGGYADTRTVTITYHRPPDGHALDVLRQGFSVWTTQALQGGYISAPMGTRDYFLNADDDLHVLDDEVTWGIEDYQLDHDALNAVVNFLAAYHGQVSELREVALE